MSPGIFNAGVVSSTTKLLGDGPPTYRYATLCFAVTSSRMAAMKSGHTDEAGDTSPMKLPSGITAGWLARLIEPTVNASSSSAGTSTVLPTRSLKCSEYPPAAGWGAPAPGAGTGLSTCKR